MQDYFISYGTGLSSNDVNSNENINIKFYANLDNDGWNIKINNRATEYRIVLLTHNNDAEYYLFKGNEPYEYLQFNVGGMNNPRNLVEIGMHIQKYVEKDLEVSI